jgi:hypothetical protein
MGASASADMLRRSLAFRHFCRAAGRLAGGNFPAKAGISAGAKIFRGKTCWCCYGLGQPITRSIPSLTFLP